MLTLSCSPMFYNMDVGKPFIQLTVREVFSACPFK